MVQIMDKLYSIKTIHLMRQIAEEYGKDITTVYFTNIFNVLNVKMYFINH